jgi:cytochrome c oxidase subunit 4
MNERAAGVTAWSLLRRLLPVWGALLLLLAATCALAYVPMGTFNVVVALAIAAAKAGLVAALFMGLARSRPLLRLAAGAGFFWLIIMFSLTLSDYLMRS